MKNLYFILLSVLLLSILSACQAELKDPQKEFPAGYVSLSLDEVVFDEAEKMKLKLDGQEIISLASGYKGSKADQKGIKIFDTAQNLKYSLMSSQSGQDLAVNFRDAAEVQGRLLIKMQMGLGMSFTAQFEHPVWQYSFIIDFKMGMGSMSQSVTIKDSNQNQVVYAARKVSTQDQFGNEVFHADKVFFSEHREECILFFHLVDMFYDLAQMNVTYSTGTSTSTSTRPGTTVSPGLKYNNDGSLDRNNNPDDGF